MTTALASFGLPPEKWDDYLVEIGGMVGMAFDDYFASLKEGCVPRQAAAPADLND